MPPKEQASKKNVEKKKSKTIEDRTFGEWSALAAGETGGVAPLGTALPPHWRSSRMTQWPLGPPGSIAIAMAMALSPVCRHSQV